MSEVVVVSSGGLDDILMEPLMIRKLPRAEVRDERLNHINLNWILEFES